MTLRVIRRAMDRSGERSFLLDGYPRTREQALQFEHDVGQCEFVLHLDADDDVCRQRLSQVGRSDDTRAAITKRLNTFARQTTPVLDLYASSRDVRTVNANATEEEVFRAVDKHFAPTVVFAMGESAIISKACKEAALITGHTFLSTRDLLQAEVARGVGIGLKLTQMIESGMIVPVDVTLEVIRNAMLASGNDRFILEGFPRQVDQVLAFETSIARCSTVLHFADSAAAAPPSSSTATSTINYFSLQGYVQTIQLDGNEVNSVRQALASDVVFVVGAEDASVSAHCGRLAADCGFVHIDYDALLRATVSRGSSQGRDIGDMLSSGKILPASTSVNLLKGACGYGKLFFIFFFCFFVVLFFFVSFLPFQ